MESALTPREIQARIRAGESLEAVAQAAGVPVAQIDVYAGPVIAEREHVWLLARGSQVRRRGESSAQRLLGDVVTETLTGRGVELEAIAWDAWRDENRRWTVQVSWPLDDTSQHALFDFDQRGRYSTARNPEAKALIDERTPVPGRPRDPDAEPTIDLNDELAIVRVVQDDAEPPAVLPDVPVARIIQLPGRQADPVEDDEPDDYAPVQLEQVDGVYDIIPNPRNDMDVLYDMLAGFNEDSVRIYTGLTQPVSPAPDPAPEMVTEDAPTQPETSPRPTTRRRAAAKNRPPQPVAGPEPASQHSATDSAADQDAATQTSPAPAAATPRSRPTQPEPAPAPEQETLVGEPDSATPKAPRKRRKRASVPTWDEIMFGGPNPEQ